MNTRKHSSQPLRHHPLVDLLPSVALILFAFVPFGYLLGIPVWWGRLFAPSVAMIALWGLVGFTTRRIPVSLVIALLAVAPLVAINVSNSDSLAISVGWVAVAAFTVLLPVWKASQDDSPAGTKLLTTWLWAAAVLGLAAAAEAAVAANPLQPYLSVDQHWSIYRVSVSLGHPLMAGTFFAVSGSIALAQLLNAQSHRLLALVALASSTTGAAATGSRSSVVALAVGLGVVLALALGARSIAPGRKALGLILIAAALFALILSPALRDRAGSQEALGSSDVRQDVLELAIRMFAQSPVVGHGIGASQQTSMAYGFSLPLESGVLGTLVGGGVGLSIVIACALVAILIFSLRRGAHATVGGTVAFLTAGIAFPLWESVPASLLLLGLLYVLPARQGQIQNVVMVNAMSIERGRGLR